MRALLAALHLQLGCMQGGRLLLRPLLGSLAGLIQGGNLRTQWPRSSPAKSAMRTADGMLVSHACAFRACCQAALQAPCSVLMCSKLRLE